MMRSPHPRRAEPPGGAAPSSAARNMAAVVIAASRARYRVVALATGLAMITHLDRACIATLAPGIMRDLGLTTVQMGYVFTVFQLAYAVFEIPTAWWADRRGTRSVLSRIVLWWSCLTAATGAAFSYPVLLAVRFLFGVGE